MAHYIVAAVFAYRGLYGELNFMDLWVRGIKAWDILLPEASSQEGQAVEEEQLQRRKSGHGVSDGREANERLLTVDGRAAGKLKGQSFDAQSPVKHHFCEKMRSKRLGRW